MKKLLFFVCCFVCSYAISAPKASPASRTEKEIKKIIARYPAVSVLFPDFQSEKTKFKEVSLKDWDENELNPVEKELLAEFRNVTVCGYIPLCYFVHDADKRIGVYNFEGEEIVPPLDGYFSMGMANFHLGGLENQREYMQGLQRSAETSMYKQAVTFGSFQAVVHAKTLEPVIPFGKYDDIRGVFKGASIWYFVGKFSEDGTMLWGVCDEQGAEIIPPSYLGIYREGGKFVGTNDRTMKESEVLAQSKIVQIKARNEAAAQRMDKWVEALGAFGNTMAAVATVVEQTGSGDVSNAGSPNGGGTKAGSLSNADNHPGMSGTELQGRYDDAISNIRKIRQSWGMHAGTSGEVSQRQNLNHVKKNIQRIKLSAQKHRVVLKLDPLETWNP